MSGAGEVAVRGSTGVMSITPFAADGSVDHAELRRHLERLAPHPVSVYLCSQGSGEGLALSLEEKEAVYRSAVAGLGGRRELVGAGIGLAGDTATAVEQVARLSVTGVDAVQVFPPRTGALRPRGRELAAYFAEVVGAARCPVVLGENVALVGYELGRPLIEELLGRHEEIEGLSYTAPVPVSGLTDLVRSLRHRVSIRTGLLHHVHSMAVLGGDGVLCFDGNLVPGLVAEVWTALCRELPGTAAMTAALLEVNAVLSRHGNPASIKAALSHAGLPGGLLRPPLLGLDEHRQTSLARELDRIRAEHRLDRWF